MTSKEIPAALLAFKGAERAGLRGELHHHLGYLCGVAKPADAANQRNGKDAKTVMTKNGSIRTSGLATGRAVCPFARPLLAIAAAGNAKFGLPEVKSSGDESPALAACCAGRTKECLLR